jgi:Flp pilus assembly protein TadG
VTYLAHVCLGVPLTHRESNEFLWHVRCSRRVTMTHSAPRHGNGTGRVGLRRQRGQGLVEMALLMPLIVGLLVGLIELSRVQRWQVTLTAAAHAGALFASKSKADAADTEGIKARALAEIAELAALNDGHSTPVVSVTLGTPTGDGFGKQQVDVSVSLSVPPLFTVAGFPSMWNLKETATARVLEWEPGA